MFLRIESFSEGSRCLQWENITSQLLRHIFSITPIDCLRLTYLNRSTSSPLCFQKYDVLLIGLHFWHSDTNYPKWSNCFVHCSIHFNDRFVSENWLPLQHSSPHYRFLCKSTRNHGTKYCTVIHRSTVRKVMGKVCCYFPTMLSSCKCEGSYDNVSNIKNTFPLLYGTSITLSPILLLWLKIDIFCCIVCSSFTNKK